MILRQMTKIHLKRKQSKLSGGWKFSKSVSVVEIDGAELDADDESFDEETLQDISAELLDQEKLDEMEDVEEEEFQEFAEVAKILNLLQYVNMQNVSM